MKLPTCDGRTIKLGDEPDLRGALVAAARRGAVLNWADLAGADLSGAVLNWADLSGADLSGAVLNWADLAGADLSGAVLREADLRRADLSGAVLNWADLRGAVLNWADLNWADLAGAVLREADLRRADLSGAVLREADLRRADLSGADLAGAVLRGAVLRGAVLRGADLRGADLSGSDLRDADLSGADLCGAVGLPAAPVVPAIDAAVLAAVEAGAGRLEMRAWHACATTHCRAGWAIRLAGEAGRALEQAVGPCAAAALIYAASRPGQRVPDFFATTQATLEDLRVCVAAARDTPPGPGDPCGRESAAGPTDPD